jgi:hypothetical protein
MPQVSLSGSLNYQQGGGTVNENIVAVGSYLASSLGTMDIPSGSSSGATFSLPLGGVERASCVHVKNSVGTTMILRMQGNPTGLPLTDGSEFVCNSPKPPALTLGPLSAIVVQLTAAQTAYGYVDYEIFGD